MAKTLPGSLLAAYRASIGTQAAAPAQAPAQAAKAAQATKRAPAPAKAAKAGQAQTAAAVTAAIVAAVPPALLATLPDAPFVITFGKVTNFMGSDMPGFNTTMYVNGVKVAKVDEFGDGGPMRYDWVSDAAREMFTEYVKAVGEDDEYVGIDMYVCKQLQDWEVAAKIAKMKQTKVLFRLPTDDPDLFRHVVHKGNPAGATTYIMNKYPNAVIL